MASMGWATAAGTASPPCQQSDEKWLDATESKEGGGGAGQNRALLPAV